ncbi:MAG: translation initiation factor [Myxococcota bacterium]|nr:translation initiation factor [Myxococcota bacterium]
MKKGDRDKSKTPLTGPFHNPFGGLDKLRGTVAPASPAPAADRPPAPAKPEKKGPARAVVRHERSGRGGKEVTVVEHLGLSSPELEKWLKVLKQGLGCGGVVEIPNLVLQGDQRERLPALLRRQGVRQVTVGT